MERNLVAITLTRTQTYVERLLDAMDKSTVQPDAHVVVNNSNRMELTHAVLKRGRAVIEPGHNTTFSEGNNLAAKAVAAEWYLLLNDDLIPEPGMVEHMMLARRYADVVGALLVHRTGSVNHAGTKVGPGIVTDHIGRGQDREAWESDMFVAVPSVTFAAALVKGSMWRELGGLSEAYRYGWEDTDYCLRVLERGGTVRVARNAVAVHDECGTRPRNGAADRMNYDTFASRWSGRVTGLLRQYQARMTKERVQGIVEG